MEKIGVRVREETRSQGFLFVTDKLLCLGVDKLPFAIPSWPRKQLGNHHRGPSQDMEGTVFRELDSTKLIFFFPASRKALVILYT